MAQLTWDREQLQDVCARGATALEDAQVDMPASAKRHQGTQRRRRGLALRRYGAEQENRRLAGLGVHLDAADLVSTCLGQPGEHRPPWVGFDQLLGDPQALRGCLRLDPHHLIGRHAKLGQPACIRLLRRGH